MTWATVIVPNMTETRAIHRAGKSEDAIQWAEKKDIKDYIVLAPGYKFASLSASELDALLKQFGDTRLGLKHDDKASVVMRLLSKYDPELHNGDGTARPGAYAAETKPAEETKAVETRTSGAAKKKAAPKAKGKALKAKAPKGHKKGLAGDDGLGREGTPARFIRELYLKGKETADIFEAAKKRFPKNDIKSASYVSWYRNDMVKRGLIKKH